MSVTDHSKRLVSAISYPTASQRDAIFSLLLLAAALVLNLAVTLLMRRHLNIASLDADEQEYWNLATGLHNSGLNAIHARRTLPFPLLSASLRALVGDNYLRVRLALSALLAVTPVIVYWLVLHRLGNRTAARLAGVVSALWPPFVRYGVTLYSDSFGLLTFLIFLLALPVPAGPNDERPWRWVQWCFAGSLLALSIQLKPLYLLYVPFALFLSIMSAQYIRRGILAAVLLMLGCAVAVLPWASYVSQREGRTIIVSANGGETLAGGLNPTLIQRDTPSTFKTPGGRTTWVGPGKWLPPGDTGYLSEQELRLPYPQMSDLLLKRARAWIYSHPGAVVYLSARKLLYLWGL
jgi:4-amino-4-deoxy-L-arabinose transferase-like glycosyltransferase